MDSISRLAYCSLFTTCYTQLISRWDVESVPTILQWFQTCPMWEQRLFVWSPVPLSLRDALVASHHPTDAAAAMGMIYKAMPLRRKRLTTAITATLTTSPPPPLGAALGPNSFLTEHGSFSTLYSPTAYVVGPGQISLLPATVSQVLSRRAFTKHKHRCLDNRSRAHFSTQPLQSVIRSFFTPPATPPPQNPRRHHLFFPSHRRDPSS